MTKRKKNKEFEYYICQYQQDVESGLWTVRKSVEEDYAYFPSKHEAEQFIKMVKDLTERIYGDETI